MGTREHTSRDHRSRRSRATIVVLGGIALGVVLVPGCSSCPPSQGNFAFIGYWDFPGEETFTLETPSPIPGQTVDFIARVYYPSYDESVLEDPENPDLEGIEVADGAHPLVVFGHGQYGLGAPTNYLGMTHLMHHLASWGYVCVSVNLDVVQGGWGAYDWGIPHRGELLLHAVDRMAQLDGDAGSLFHGRIDTSQVILMGHSRGGGGAISAVNRNLAQGSPRSIVGLGTISPVDFGTDPLAAAVPHLSIYGSWDGDLDGGDAMHIWDGGVRTAPRQFVEIYGANHFHFTDSTVYAGESVEITREDHHELAQGFFNAFFDVRIFGRDRWEWPLYLVGQKDIRPGVDEYLQILEDDVLVVDDGSPLGTEGANNLGGANDSSSLALFEDQLLNSAADHFYNQSEGLLVHWDDSGDELALSFPNQNVSTYAYLHFRAAQRPGHAFNVVDTFKDFTVRLEDAPSNTATVRVGDYLGGLQYPDFSGSLPAGDLYQHKAIPRSFRIPLADFAGVNLHNLREIAFVFDRPDGAGFHGSTGAIAIDDVELTH